MDVQLLRETFRAAVDANPRLVHDFYFGHLFRDHPELHDGPDSLFPEDMRDQEARLGQTLVLAMEHLEDSTWLKATLEELGRRHAVLYRVRPEMFPWVGRALLDTLAQAVPGWDSRCQDEWTVLVGTIADLMLTGYPDRQVAQPAT